MIVTFTVYLKATSFKSSRGLWQGVLNCHRIFNQVTVIKDKLRQGFLRSTLVQFWNGTPSNFIVTKWRVI